MHIRICLSIIYLSIYVYLDPPDIPKTIVYSRRNLSTTRFVWILLEGLAFFFSSRDSASCRDICPPYARMCPHEAAENFLGSSQKCPDPTKHGLSRTFTSICPFTSKWPNVLRTTFRGTNACLGFEGFEGFKGC